MRRAILGLLGATVMVAGLAAVPAGATTVLGTASDQARVAIYLPTAQSYWPASGCAGREVINVIAADAVEIPGTGERGRGWGDQPTCTATLIDTLSDAWLCTVLAHELGHLAGQSHTAEGFMSAGGGRVPTRECRAAAALATERARSYRRPATTTQRAAIARGVGFPAGCISVWISNADVRGSWALVRPKADAHVCPAWTGLLLLRRQPGGWTEAWQGPRVDCPLSIPARVQGDLGLCG